MYSQLTVSVGFASTNPTNLRSKTVLTFNLWLGIRGGQGPAVFNMRSIIVLSVPVFYFEITADLQKKLQKQ